MNQSILRLDLNIPSEVKLNGENYLHVVYFVAYFFSQVFNCGLGRVGSAPTQTGSVFLF